MGSHRHTAVTLWKLSNARCPTTQVPATFAELLNIEGLFLGVFYASYLPEFDLSTCDKSAKQNNLIGFCCDAFCDGDDVCFFSLL